MKSETRDYFDMLLHRLCADFGEAKGTAIADTITEELGGLRLSFPHRRRMSRETRDMRMRARFRGDNYDELAADFGLSPRQVRNIIEKGKKNGRQTDHH
jgi:Mor family transcriptional regulator